MRHALQVLAAALLAATVAAPVAAVTPGGAAQESLTGIVETAYVELGDGRDHFLYSLRDRLGRITPLEFAQGNPRSLAGSKVTLRGTRVGGSLRVRSTAAGRDLVVRSKGRNTGTGTWAAETGTTTTLSGGSGTAAVTSGQATVDAKSVAVVLFNFTDLTTTPFTKSQVADALLNNASSVKGFYEEESKGRLTMTGAVFGWYTIDDTTAGCDWPTWTSLAWDAAAAAGHDLAAYTNVMFAFPNTSACGWAGLGYVPGRYTYLNGNISVQVMTHELGHNFGLSHSNAADCRVGGTRVMIAAPADCQSVGYADPFSTMGNNALRHNHGSHLGELGWLAADEKVIGVPGNSYTITPYFGGSGLKLVRLPRGDGSFFDIDVRATYGVFDTFAAGSPATVGATIRIGLGTASPTTSPRATLLLDSTPGTSSLADAPLLVGKTMTDPVSTISIRTMSSDSSGVVVRVREGIAPTAPGSLAATSAAGGVALSWTPATDNTAVTGYLVTRDGAALATTGGTATGWTDAGAQAGASYTYTVAAVDGSANQGPSASVALTVPGGGPAPTPTPAPTATPGPAPTPTPGATSTPSPDPTAPPSNDIQAPSAPDPVTGEVTATTVALTWEPATDDTGVVAYRVTRDGRLVASPADVTWTDTRLRPETTYEYAVAALDAVGNASDEVTVTVTTLADTTAPTRPARFHKVRRHGKYVKFDWRNASDNVGVVRYYVYRVGRSTPVKMTTLSRARVRTARGAYYYVRAVDAAGNLSAKSAKVRGRR